jgi:hypothetical protein
MPITAKSNSVPREVVPQGSYLAIVIGVYDLGTQNGGQYGPQHKVLFTWELHKRSGPFKNKQGNVVTINKFYTLSFGEKATLRKDVEGMIARTFTKEEAKNGFDVEQLLGKACRIQIVHEKKNDGAISDRVGSVMALDEEENAPEAELDQFSYELDPSKGVSESVPEWIRKMIWASTEWQEKENGEPAPDSGGKKPATPVTQAEADEDIPF